MFMLYYLLKNVILMKIMQNSFQNARISLPQLLNPLASTDGRYVYRIKNVMEV